MHMKLLLFKGFFISAVLLLSACAKHEGLDGTYANKLMSYEFKPNGKVFITSFGATVESSYESEDDKTKFKKSGIPIILTVGNDGAIHGPMGMTLIKQ